VSFWVGYAVGVSQNVVAALLFGPWILNRMKKHLNVHHKRMGEQIAALIQGPEDQTQHGTGIRKEER